MTITMNPAVDQTAETEFVTDETKLRCTKTRYDPGGGGINVSRALSIMGGESTAVYPAGGCTGDFLKELVEKTGIAHIPVDISEDTRVNISIIETATEKQYRFNMPGASLQKDECNEILTVVANLDPAPAYIIGSGSLAPGVPDTFYQQTARLAHELDARFIIDTSGQPLQSALEENVFLMKPNLAEFMRLINQQIKDETQIVNAAKNMITDGKCSYIVISLGAGGALFVSEDRYEHISSPITPIKSRVGAGDSMVAGITLSLARDQGIKQAVHYGVAAGAAAVMTPGTELCRYEDVQRIYKGMMNR